MTNSFSTSTTIRWTMMIRAVSATAPVTLVICIDDMCRGAGECFHGDGELPCPVHANYV